jgi:threonine dehydratase
MVSLEQIQQAKENLPDAIVRTPLHFSAELSKLLDCSLYLKLENLQVTGSYKSRAAYTILNNLTSEQKARGAAISSSGNFAGAFAYMGSLLNVPTSVVMMEKTAAYKVEKTRQYGGEVVFCENRFEARFEMLDKLRAERGIVAVNHFEDADVISGHGTIAIEILEDNDDIDMILVPISSGGLLAGVAAAAKSIKPSLRIIGVQPKGANATYLSFRKGEIIAIPGCNTICDALVATAPGKLPFLHIQQYVDDVVVVSDEMVAKAVACLFKMTKLVVEPSGAVGLAALMSGVAGDQHQRKIAVVVSGGNVSEENYAGLLNR